MTELSIEDAFEKVFNENKPEVKEAKSNRNTFPYSTFDMCRNTGIILIKLVPEESGRPYKCLNGCFTGKIPYTNEDGSEANQLIRWCRNENYHCQLTDAQIKLNDELHDQIELCNKLREDTNNYQLFKFSYKISLLFAYLRKITHTKRTSSTEIEGDIEEYDNPKITTLYCRSNAFITSLNDAINTRKSNYDGDTSWMKDYFNRTPGNNFRFLSVTTLRPTIGYEINFDFMELPNKKIAITEEDLNEAKSLDKVFIDTTTYNEEFYADCLDKLKLYNSELSGFKAVPYTPDQTNNN